MLMKNMKELTVAFNKWKNTINKVNRFDNKSTLLDLLYHNADLFEEVIPAGCMFYRGRVFNLDDIAPTNEKYINWIETSKGPFQGYDRKECGAPPKSSAKEGRLNGAGIPFLYTCSDTTTVIYELRPTKNEKISIAKFVTKKNLILADLTKQKSYQIENHMLSDLLSKIAEEFSTPHYAGHDYYFTQFLAGQFMNLKFDGIIFDSSLNPNGKNFVFFKTNSCEAISSELYIVDNINIDYTHIARKDFEYLI